MIMQFSDCQLCKLVRSWLELNRPLIILVAKRNTRDESGRASFKSTGSGDALNGKPSRRTFALGIVPPGDVKTYSSATGANGFPEKTHKREDPSSADLLSQ